MWLKLLIGLVIIIGIGTGGYYLLSHASPNSNPVPATPKSQSLNKTFQNTTFGYSLNLPSGWSVCESAESEPTVRIGKNQKCGITWDESFLLTPTVGADYIHDRRQNEPFLFFVKRIEDEDKKTLKSSGKVDYKLTQLDQKTVLVESSYIPTDKTIKPTYIISLYKEMTPLETVILNSEESSDPKTLDKNIATTFAKSLQNIDPTTGDLIGVVSKKIPNGQTYYSEYAFGVVNKVSKEEFSLKADKDGTFLMSLPPGDYVLKNPTGEQSSSQNQNKNFTIEKGRILRLNFSVN